MSSSVLTPSTGKADLQERNCRHPIASALILRIGTADVCLDFCPSPSRTKHPAVVLFTKILIISVQQRQKTIKKTFTPPSPPHASSIAGGFVASPVDRHQAVHHIINTKKTIFTSTDIDALRLRIRRDVLREQGA